jgi:hypothetical protein
MAWAIIPAISYWFAALLVHAREHVEIDSTDRRVMRTSTLLGLRLERNNWPFDEFCGITIYRRELRLVDHITLMFKLDPGESYGYVHVALRRSSGRFLGVSAFLAPIDRTCPEAESLAARLHETTGLPIDEHN